MTETLTLKDVRAEQVAQLKNDIAAAEALKNPAADAQTAAEQQVTNDEADLAQLQAEASVLQQRFATATMKLDQHSIELQLYDNLTRRRAADIKLADDQDQLAAATRTVKSLDAKTAALQAALAPASAGLSSAGQADAAAADDRTALTTLVADAVRQAGGDDVKAQVAAAGQALATLIGGADMLAVLRSRHDHAKAIIGDKQSATARARLAALAVTQLTSAGAAELGAAEAGYDDARAAVHRWATEGPGTLDGARQALQQTIETPAFSPLVTKDIADRAKTATDSGAAAADKAFHAAAAAFIAAADDLDAVTGPKAAVDPGYNPATDDTVKAQRDAAAAAAATQADAQAARTAEFTQQMIDWDLALPPDTFTLAIATFDALDQIAGLAALDVTALLARLDAAETRYAGAVKDQARIGTLGQAAADEQASRQADADKYAAEAEQRVLAVVRGDM